VFLKPSPGGEGAKNKELGSLIGEDLKIGRYYLFLVLRSISE